MEPLERSLLACCEAQNRLLWLALSERCRRRPWSGPGGMRPEEVAALQSQCEALYSRIHRCIDDPHPCGPAHAVEQPGASPILP